MPMHLFLALGPVASTSLSASISTDLGRVSIPTFAGVTIGTSIGIALLVAMFFLLRRRHRRAQREDDTVEHCQ